MALREICKYPDPILREKCAPLTDFDDSLHSLLSDMADTMYDENGIGLAAPQIGLPLQITVIDVDREDGSLIEVINPQITWYDGEVDSEEGCLSIPDYRDTIKRADQIKVTAFDRHGNEYEIETDGLLSICLQHEIDHLNGVLFVDHLSRMKKDIFKRWFKKNGPL